MTVAYEGKPRYVFPGGLRPAADHQYHGRDAGGAAGRIAFAAELERMGARGLTAIETGSRGELRPVGGLFASSCGDRRRRADRAPRRAGRRGARWRPARRHSRHRRAAPDPRAAHAAAGQQRHCGAARRTRAIRLEVEPCRCRRAPDRCTMTAPAPAAAARAATTCGGSACDRRPLAAAANTGWPSRRSRLKATRPLPIAPQIVFSAS